MAIAAHHDQIESFIGRDRQYRWLDIGAFSVCALYSRGKAVQSQIGRQVRRGSAFLRFVDGDDGDRTSAGQERRRVTNRSRRQTASIPGDPNAVRNSEGALMV